MGAEKLLAIDNLSFAYDPVRPLVKDCTCAFNAGEVVLIIGANGAGKTTLLRLMAGALKPHRGWVTYAGQPVDRLRAAERARRIAVVEQETNHLFPFTVREVVLMGRFARISGAFENAQDYAVADQALAVTNTTAIAERSILELSGGERRRVEIARALAQETPLILFDEPLAHLDLKQERDMVALISDLNRQHGRTVVIVSHHVEKLLPLVTSAYVLSNGALARIGDAAQLKNEDAIIEMCYKSRC